jgi:type I restriction enzyme S subunit
MSSNPQTRTAEGETNPALVPKLRFPEFRGAEGWKSKQLGELFSDRQEAGLSGLPLLSLMDKDGIVPQEDSNRKNNSNSDKSKYLRVVPGDIAYNTMRMWEGRSALVGLEGLVSPAYTVCEPQLGVHSLLFSYYFKTPQLIEQFRRFSQGLVKDTLNLKYPALAQISAPVPTYPEQQKIAECLSSVDELLAAQARKVDALKTHKKGLMQQLFPREGETQPRLRFPEFQNAGEWSGKTFGQVSDVLMCKRIFAEETNPNAGVPFYKIGTLGGVPDAFISRERFEDYKSRYNYPRKGEVLITCSGTVGKCLPFDGKDAYFQDSNIVWLDNPTGEVSNEFLFILLTNVNWGGLNSTTITRIYGPDLRGMTINYPEDKAEQQRIADCLTSLDTLITAETQKHENLKTHKRGLMQQLFPPPEEIADL